MPFNNQNASRPVRRTIWVQLRPSQSTSTSRLDDIFRHPLFLTVVGFLFTGALGTALTYFFNELTQKHNIENTTRNNALQAISDLSDLVNERRERAELVISSIGRGAPEVEIDARKTKYDEALVSIMPKFPAMFCA